MKLGVFASGLVGRNRSEAFARFARGFLDLLPLWTGAIPVGIAYAVAARSAGLTPAAIQGLSLIVFSAAAQVSAVALLAGGAPVIVLLGTVAALNAELVLLGLATGRQLRPSGAWRLIAAFFLTDGAYGVAAAGGRLTLPRLLGAELSMFVAWNAGTALGIAVGQVPGDPRRLGVDFVVPLTFLAVLLPLVRTRPAALSALSAGIATLFLAPLAPGVAVLGAGLVGSAAGAWGARRAGSLAAGGPGGEERGAR